jgi:serine phosphatase RsbU (regulator of sigma subunit)
MLFLFLALSLYLSWDFADTHHQLELKLAEVQDLSQQALEQERLAERREVERRLLAQEHERHKEQLEAARRLQISLLPADPPRTPGVEVEFEMRTASEVGGDYYDYRQGDGGALLVAIGDATGHGIDAGLLVAATKGLFHAIPVDADVIESLERIASGLAGLGLRRMFMALTLVRYENGRVDLATAGMPPLLLRRQGREDLEELSVHAPPLGSIADARYTPLRTGLRPGDTLLALTDGLPERRNGSDELLGYTRLAEAYRGVSDQSLDTVRAALFGAADDWAAGEPRHDDETVVLLRRRG